MSAALLGAIRLLAYYNEEVSMEIAKIFPLTILVIFILSPNFFSLDRVLTNLVKIPELITNILYFLILIVAIELILRVFNIIGNAMKSSIYENSN